MAPTLGTTVTGRCCCHGGPGCSVTGTVEAVEVVRDHGRPVRYLTVRATTAAHRVPTGNLKGQNR